MLPAWEPLGRALEAYLEGDPLAEAALFHEDGRRGSLPAAALFREDGFPESEDVALELARGRILDAGAGAGAHTLALQEQGLEALALDISPQAVEVMRRRGIREARQGDLLELAGETFDTVLLLMNGCGLAGDLRGLERLLSFCQGLVTPGGAVLVDSCDLRLTDLAEEQALLEERRRQGRYFGEVRYQMAFRDERGEPFSWLFVDSETLSTFAERHGWGCQVIFEDDDGAYLARLASTLA